MADRSQVRCQTDGCAGVLGALAKGLFLPAGHLHPGRDLYVQEDGRLAVRCSFCGSWHRVEANGRLHIVVAPVPAA